MTHLISSVYVINIHYISIPHCSFSTCFTSVHIHIENTYVYEGDAGTDMYGSNFNWQKQSLIIDRHIRRIYSYHKSLY